MLLLKGLNILLPMLIIMLLGELLFCFVCFVNWLFWGLCLFCAHMMCTLLFVMGVHMMCT